MRVATELDVDAAFEQGRAAWPTVPLDREAFAQHLRERAASDAQHLGDLYLACAFLRGITEAFAAMERCHFARLPQALRSIDPSPAFVDEVHQTLRERLFTSSKLASYSGRGSLESWVAVSAQRVAISLKRRDRQRRGAPVEAADARRAEHDPELEYLKARHRDEVGAAVADALASLPDRERVVLRLSLVGGASHAQIATMYGVNQSTVTRWISRAHERIWRRVRVQLSDRLGLRATEIESVIRLMRSDLDLSLSRILGSEPPG